MNSITDQTREIINSQTTHTVGTNLFRSFLLLFSFVLLVLNGCETDDSGDDKGKETVTYIDSQGKKVNVPFGSMSCALKIISSTGASSSSSAIGLNHILGAPDANKSVSGSAFTLAAKGEVTLEFGVYITNGKGDDLHVFQSGAAICELKVDISENLSAWIHAGDIGGTSLGIDISANVSASGKYRYVRLTNTGGSPVNLDAVAALHPVKIGSDGKINDDIEFTDTRGNMVTIPGGALSCATFVVDFKHGTPWMSDPRANDPKRILGAPDYNRQTDENYICLGCEGVIVIGFNVSITDGPGNDIYVFEIGPDVEATKVEVSNDLINWTHVGNADGSISGVDISGKVPKGAKYRYVRLTDLKTACASSWPGADIDAVAVIYPAFN